MLGDGSGDQLGDTTQAERGRRTDYLVYELRYLGPEMKSVKFPGNRAET